MTYLRMASKPLFRFRNLKYRFFSRETVGELSFFLLGHRKFALAFRVQVCLHREIQRIF